MARVGTDENTGRLLYGWAHCKQSLKTILYTELHERPQRRGFGSRLVSLLDKPQVVESVLDLYEATAAAIEPRTEEGRQLGEPGFVLLRVNVDASQPGTVVIKLAGVYFEDGHLGDYSNPSPQEVSFIMTVADLGSRSEVK